MEKFKLEKIEDISQIKKFEIVDERISPDKAQMEAIKLQMEKDGLYKTLSRSKNFLGKYSNIDSSELSINIIEQSPDCIRTINGKNVIVSLKDMKTLNTELSKDLEKHFGKLPEEVINEINISVICSIVLHESIHGLLNSKPGSEFHSMVQNIAKENDDNADLSTLLDEGIAYAIQSIFSKNIYPIGKLEPKINESDKPIVKTRKALGNAISPIVSDYFEQGREMDGELIRRMINIVLELNK